MPSSRTVTALSGLAVSIIVSVAAWYYFGTVVFFLVVPFVPLLLRRGGSGADDGHEVRVCPACGFRTADPGYEYCPRDGSGLE